MTYIKNILVLVSVVLYIQTANAQKMTIPALTMDSLLIHINSDPNKVMIVNFWSTWCKPCIEEIPGFIAVATAMKAENVQLLLVSLDTKNLYQSGKLQTFLQKQKWNSVKNVWLNETDADHYCPKIDSSWSGVIPATLIIHPSKNYHRFYEQSLSAEALEGEIKKAVKG